MHNDLERELLKDALRVELERDFIKFVKFFFKIMTGQPFILSWHHELMVRKLMDIVNGRCKRLIINIFPIYNLQNV